MFFLSCLQTFATILWAHNLNTERFPTKTPLSYVEQDMLPPGDTSMVPLYQKMWSLPGHFRLKAIVLYLSSAPACRVWWGYFLPNFNDGSQEFALSFLRCGPHWGALTGQHTAQTAW